MEVFDALGRSGRLDRRAVIQICPSASIGMCGYSKTTINEVVAAGYKAICEWAPLVSHSQHQSLLVVHSLKERHLVAPTSGYISCRATWLSHHSVCTRPDPAPARLPARADNDWSTFYLLHKNATVRALRGV